MTHRRSRVGFGFGFGIDFGLGFNFRFGLGIGPVFASFPQKLMAQCAIIYLGNP
jgi:hypothetical protein